MSERDKNHRPGDGSTGPTTPAGKERCSRNAIAHGARSENHIILPTESADDYEKIREYWHAEYTPGDDLEAAMLKRICERAWILARCERLYDDALANAILKEPDSSKWTPDDHKHIQLMDRYRNSADRAFRRAWADLENLRKNRIAAIAQAERLQRLVFINERDKIRRNPPSQPKPSNHFQESSYVEEEQTPRIPARDEEPDEFRPPPDNEE